MTKPRRNARSTLPRQPLEKSIHRNILRKLNDLPETYAKKTLGSSGSAGWPDIICCHHGKMLALEVKRPGGKPTALQTRELTRWETAGAISAVVTSWEDVQQILDRSR